MAKYSIEILQGARVDLRGAYDWYFERNPDAAASFIREIEVALATISDTPFIWPSHIEGTRRCMLRRFPFSIVYRVKESNILIVAFAHGRRRPGYWRNR
jgi:plasmid stabilization system protein ParE